MQVDTLNTVNAKAQAVESNYKMTLSLMNKQLQEEAVLQSKERNGLIKPIPPPTASSAFSNMPPLPISSQGNNLLVKAVPDELVPELCVLIAEAGADGIQKITLPFTEKYPNISKRQCEMKISELAIKEKRGDDSKSIWHLRPEFSYYDPKVVGNFGGDLQIANDAMPILQRSAVSSINAIPKRVRDEEQIEATMDPPKKAKSAFNFFLKDYRQEAEQELKADDAYSTEALKQLLLSKWEKLNSAGLTTTYIAMAEEDKKRFDSECEAYQNYLEESQKKKKTKK